MANARVAKLKFLRRDSKSTTSDSDIKLQQGQPFIDMTTDPEENPGTLYVGQGKGSLEESGVNVKHSDKAGQLDHEINTFVNLESQSNVFWNGSETLIVPGVGGVLPVANGGTGSAKFDVDNVGAGVLATTYGGTGRSNGTIAQADEADALTDYMTFKTYLNTESNGLIKEGGKTCNIGVDGVLPISHGGTGNKSLPTFSSTTTREDILDYCRISNVSSTGIVGGAYTTIGSADATGCYAIIGTLLIAFIEWVGELPADWALRVDINGWLNSDGCTITTVLGVGAKQRVNPDSKLGYYRNSDNCSIYFDNTPGYIYVGEDVDGAEGGFYITAYCVLK